MAEEREPSLEEIVEQIRRLKVEDVLLSSAATIGQLGHAKLDPAAPDLAQARVAIESLRALVPVLEGSVPAETLRELNQTVASLQLAYASAAGAGAQAAPQDAAGASEGAA